VSLAGRAVLVTGADGFVGHHLCGALQRAEARVWGTGEHAGPAPPGLAGWHTMDLLVPDQVDAAVSARPPELVVHLAGQSSAARSFEEPARTYRVNAIGTWNVLDAVRRHAPAARVLVVGSGEVYGPQAAGTRVAESAPFRPVSPYALSKAAADALSEAFGRRHGTDIVRTRSFGHAGPG
jgi:GDP-4-dehydro-6-deoxy-D-mannose reductase